jgi:hypothetical protein
MKVSKFLAYFGGLVLVASLAGCGGGSKDIPTHQAGAVDKPAMNVNAATGQEGGARMGSATLPVPMNRVHP